MTENTKKPNGDDFSLPVADISFLVKALLREGLEIQEIRCSIHIGDLMYQVDLILVDADSVVEPGPIPGGLSHGH